MLASTPRASSSSPPPSSARTGMVFDISEFSVHDGPGLRTTVFLKGCPLRCSWCHNPEGLLSGPQEMRSAAGRRVAGRAFDAAELAEILNRQASLLRPDGGVTFSGGEPLAQAAFVADVIERLESLHVAVETSGYGSEADFRRLIERADLVLFGLKLADRAAHRRWTGADNGPVLRNVRVLVDMRKPFVVRVPLIPGVTDTVGNLRGIAGLIEGARDLVRVELLPHNRAAGGKYAACGMQWRPGFDESRSPRVEVECFEDCGVEVCVL